MQTQGYILSHQDECQLRGTELTLASYIEVKTTCALSPLGFYIETAILK